MNKKIIIGSIIGIGVIAILALASSGSPKSSEAIAGKQINQSQENKIKADKVQVFVFHSTQRCYSCITIGKYAGETVTEYFQSELRDGKIEFREINVDLPENQELARKFQAGGSSLFINAITDEKDNISEDVTVWRLVNNETQFKNYLRGKLNGLFGK